MPAISDVSVSVMFSDIFEVDESVSQQVTENLATDLDRKTKKRGGFGISLDSADML